MNWGKFITRKFVAATLTVGLMVCVWVASNWLSNARENLPALLTAMVAALSAYVAGNVIDGRTDAGIHSDDASTTVVVNNPPPSPSKP